VGKGRGGESKGRSTFFLFLLLRRGRFPQERQTKQDPAEGEGGGGEGKDISSIVLVVSVEKKRKVDAAIVFAGGVHKTEWGEQPFS